jgi:hypothetical protein
MRRSGLAAALAYSCEQLREHHGREWEIKGMGRWVTSRDGSRELERRRERSGALGRWRWRHDCTVESPVSASREE